MNEYHLYIRDSGGAEATAPLGSDEKIARRLMGEILMSFRSLGFHLSPEYFGPDTWVATEDNEHTVIQLLTVSAN